MPACFALSHVSPFQSFISFILSSPAVLHLCPPLGGAHPTVLPSNNNIQSGVETQQTTNVSFSIAQSLIFHLLWLIKTIESNNWS